MKMLTLASGILFAGSSFPTSVHAKEPPAAEKTATPDAAKSAAVDWGQAEDPDKDCEFTRKEGKLAIKVPGETRTI